MIAVTVGAWLVLAGFVVVCWPHLNTRRRWRAVALGLALAFSLAHQSLYGTLLREAFVTFRYAHNLAAGHGPVYNPGEYVEGYPSFLWTVLLALLARIVGEDGLVGGGQVLGVLATLGCVLAAHVLAGRVVQRARPHGSGVPAVGVAAAALTAGASSLGAYGYSGLETPLFVLLLLLTCLAVVVDRPVVAGVLIAAVVMTRPEGLVPAAVLLAWLTVEALRGRGRRWSPVAFALGALVVLVPWTAWRVTLYEDAVPNAVAARSGGSFVRRVTEGWDYFAGFALGHQALVLLFVAAVALLLNRRRVDSDVARARSLIWLLFALAGALSAAVIVAGGGWLPTWRLLAPVPPFLAVAATAAYGIVVLTSPGARSGEARPADAAAPVGPGAAGRPYGGVPLVRRRTAPVAALAVGGLFLVVTTTHPQALPAVRDSGHTTAGMAAVGAWLDGTLGDGAVISTHETPALAYHAGPTVVVVDVFGRTDEHIARDATDRGFVDGRFVARDYDYVVNVRRPLVAVEEAAYTDEQQCGIHPAYAGVYEVASFRHAPKDHWVTLYLRRAMAPELVGRLAEHPDFEYVSCL